MDFIGKQCPVCNKDFLPDEDIVVCPECGTPHHRECYEQLGRCINDELHAQGYDYSQNQENTEQKSNAQICSSCGKENDPDAFFCKYCAAPLTPKNTQQNEEFNTQPKMGGIPYPFMDPLAGVPAGEDLGDGVTAGEAAKYVKQNTPYFIRVFSNISKLNRSKFNFAAALFSGGYMLYRKMYKLGAVITVLQAAMMILSTIVRIAYDSVYTEIANQYVNSTSAMQVMEYFSKLAAKDLFILYLPSIFSIVQIGIMIACGVAFNRMYFKHCKADIARIKSEAKPDENPETILQTKGGVNMPLAISLLITNMIINYLPGIIQGML